MLAVTATLDDIAPSGTIAVLAPHPDDETLGCGGLIARAAAAGRSTSVVSLTSGGASHPASRLCPPFAMARRRLDELDAALAALGVEPRDNGASLRLELEDGGLATRDPQSIATRLAAAFRNHGVTAVMTTGPDDAHPDHRAAFEIGRRAAAEVGARLWSYPVRATACAALAASGADHVRLDVAAWLERKRAAIACHASQLEYGVPDDPAGFHLTDDDLAWHLQPYEAFVRRSVSSR